LYLAARTRLVVQLAAVTGEVGSAEDLVDEAFVRAWSRWRQVRGYADPEAWVRAVAFNLARDRWRRLRRQAALRMRLARPSWVEEPSVEHLDVLAALARLPQTQREAVVAHHLLDLPVDEIAEQLGVPIGTVKARLSRGRKALADLLGLGSMNRRARVD
jgi:RNA polymerase sigma-70 factor, ECF subfamily